MAKSYIVVFFMLATLFSSAGMRAMQQPDMDVEYGALFERISPLIAAENFEQARTLVHESPYSEVFGASLLEIIDEAQRRVAGAVPAVVGPVDAEPDLDRDYGILYERIAPLMAEGNFEQARTLVHESPYFAIFGETLFELIDAAQARVEGSIPSPAVEERPFVLPEPVVLPTPVVHEESVVLPEPVVLPVPVVSDFGVVRQEVEQSLTDTNPLDVLMDIAIVRYDDLAARLSVAQMMRLIASVEARFNEDLTQALEHNDLAHARDLVDGLSMLVEQFGSRADLPARRVLQLSQEAAYRIAEYQDRRRVQQLMPIEQRLAELMDAARTGAHLIGRAVFDRLSGDIERMRAELPADRITALLEEVEQRAAEALELNKTQRAVELEALITRAIELYRKNDPQALQALKDAKDVTPESHPQYQNVARFLGLQSRYAR